MSTVGITKLTEAKRRKLSVRDTRMLDKLAKELATLIIDRVGDLDLPIFAAEADRVEAEVMKRLKAEVPQAFDSDGSLTEVGDREFDRIYDEVDRRDTSSHMITYDYLLKVISRHIDG